jgi:hypothetical protein
MIKINEMIKIAQIHCTRINFAISNLSVIFPLSKDKIDNFSNEEVLHIELLISRFAKLQDYIGRILINEFLKCKGEDYLNLTMIDKINKLEKLRIIDNAEIWQAMREARNHISHEYPDMPELTA